MSDYTVTGRNLGGQLVTSHGQVFRVAAKGRRYHEDVRELIYDASPARPPKDFAASQEIRGIIETLLRDPTARAAGEQSLPAEIARWTDQVPGSYASRPYLTLHEGGVVRAVRPVYDDAPQVAVATDPRLAAQVRKLMAVAPVGVHLPTARVQERTVRVERASKHYEAAQAIPGARPEWPKQVWPGKPGYDEAAAMPMATQSYEGGPWTHLTPGDPVLVPVTAWRAAGFETVGR
jgi:hypothetical protein